MAEKQDIREDQMTIANTVDYLRGLKGKDSVLITLESIFVGWSIKNVGSIGGNTLLDKKNTFGYAYGTEDGSDIAGPFISIGNDVCQMQLKGEHRGLNLKFRTVKYDTGEPVASEWKSVTLT